MIADARGREKSGLARTDARGRAPEACEWLEARGGCVMISAREVSRGPVKALSYGNECVQNLREMSYEPVHSGPS